MIGDCSEILVVYYNCFVSTKIFFLMTDQKMQ